MADIPRWQLVQEEWNSLVRIAQDAGIPRIREIKVGPSSNTASRMKRLQALKSQLKGRGINLPEHFPKPEAERSDPQPTSKLGLSSLPRPALRTGRVKLQLPTPSSPPKEQSWASLSTSERVDRVKLRHDMPLRNFDITVTFGDGTFAVMLAMDRDILSAIGVAGREPSRTWTPERLGSITSITWNQEQGCSREDEDETDGAADDAAMAGAATTDL